MKETIDIVDHAAQQSDRWLLVFIISLGITGVAMLWKWMINDRDKISARLTQITDRHIQVTENLAQVVTNNTAVLHEVKEEIKRK